MNEETQKKLFSSQRGDWRTPADFLIAVRSAFLQGAHFDIDAAATAENSIGRDFLPDALTDPWPKDSLIWCNPPYGRTTGRWLEMGYDASQRGSVAVFLLPARTDTVWFQTWVPHANTYLIKGRLRFSLPGLERPMGAPFPSCLMLFPGEGKITLWDWKTTDADKS